MQIDWNELIIALAGLLFPRSSFRGKGGVCVAEGQDALRMLSFA